MDNDSGTGGAVWSGLPPFQWEEKAGSWQTYPGEPPRSTWPYIPMAIRHWFCKPCFDYRIDSVCPTQTPGPVEMQRASFRSSNLCHKSTFE